MRVLAIAACAAVIFASDQANAACGKGMLWPYVRNPGDCLTDAEIAAGKSGVYNGPVNTAPDVSAIPPAPAQPANVSVPGGTNGRGLLDGPRGVLDSIGGLFGGRDGSTATPASPKKEGATLLGSLFGENSGTTLITSGGEAGTFSCTKGYFWPFYRSPGDCLTDIEKKNGQKGVYGGGTGIVPTAVNATVVTATPATEAPAAAATGTPAPAGNPPAASDTPAMETCHKGFLWPFVRSAGDCPTDIEKKEKAGSR